MRQYIWNQPLRTMAAWKAQGIDTLWGYVPDNATLDDYLGGAKQSGLSIVLQHNYITPEIAAKYKGLIIGIASGPDEPDSGGNTPASVMISQYQSLKAQYSDLPIYINFDAHRFPYVQPSEYIEYCKAGDVLAYDFYPLNATGNPLNIPLLGEFTKDLKVWGNGKPVVAFIETDNQDLSLAPYIKGSPLESKVRGPKPDEFELEIRTVIDAGVDGIAYFPDDIGAGWISFNHDDPAIDKRWTELQPLIKGIPTKPTPATPATAKKVVSTMYIYDYTRGKGED
jgi:hypothetical protein